MSVCHWLIARWYKTLKNIILSFFLLALTSNALAVLPVLASIATDVGSSRNLVLVYYANEASRQVEQSPNYVNLLSLLERSNSPIATKLINTIKSDTMIFREVVKRDEQAFLEAANRLGFDLAIFTNSLALDGKYLFYSSKMDLSEIRVLPKISFTSNVILQTSPLSRPDIFGANLMEIASLYPPNSLDIILITNSHGSEDMALMPRVNTNLSFSNAAEELLQRLEYPEQGGPAEWALLQGTRKLEYWDAISKVSALKGVRFPLVFRQSCSSGLQSWQEFRSVPSSVNFISHSAMANINIRQVNYESVFKSIKQRKNILSTLELELGKRGIHVNTKRTIWFSVLLIFLGSIHPIIYIGPIVIWLIWVGLINLKADRKLLVNSSYVAQTHLAPSVDESGEGVVHRPS